MKKFALRVILFVLLAVAAIGGFCAVEIAAEIWSYRRELVAPEGASVFVCGDSKSEMGLNPAVWPELFNFSLTGRPLDQTYLTAIDLFAANHGRIKTFLIDVSPESASFDYNLPVGQMGGAERYMLVYFLHRGERVRQFANIVGWIRDLMADKRLHLISRVIRGKREFRSSLVSGYKRMKKCLKRSDSVRYWRNVRVESERVRDALANPSARIEFLELLDKTISVAKAGGAEVILMNTPWHRDLIEACGADEVLRYTDFVGAYARRKGCRYLNLMEVGFPDDCWYNASHLNEIGAGQLTALVRARLKGDW